MSSQQTLILYFFQGDPCESIENPNAFLANTGSQVSFSQFQNLFPVKNGNFHFRFQAENKTYGYVWMV